MELNGFLRRVVIAGVLLVPVIPAIVFASLFTPFITGKSFTFRMIVEIVFAVWVVLALRDASFRPKGSVVLVAFSVFLGVTALADVLGVNPYRSFWSNYERMEGLIAHIHLFAYFLVMVSVLREEKLWHRLFFTSFGVNAALAACSFFQLSGVLPISQGDRLEATFGNASYLAVYLLFQTFLAGCFLVKKSSLGRFDRILYTAAGLVLGGLLAVPSGAPAKVYLLVVLGLVAASAVVSGALYVKSGRIFLSALLLADLFLLYKTGTRGVILGLVGGTGLVILLFAIGNWRNPRIRTLSVVAGAVLLLGFGTLLAFRSSPAVRSDPTLSRFAFTSLNDTTTSSRTTIWPMSWKGFRERPILGWGQDNFILVFSKYYEPALWNREQWFDRSHNVFLDWLIAGGILGLLAYLSLFASGLYALWKNARFTFNEKSVLTGLLAAYFFQNLFTFDNLTSYLLFVSVLGFVSTQAPPVEAPVPARGVRRDRAAAVRLSYASLPFLLAGLGFALYAANAKPLAASRNLVRALAPPSGVLSDSLAYFKEVFDAGTFGSGEAREQMVLAALRLRAINAPDSVKREFLTRARSEMLRQIEQAPQDARYELYLGSLLETYGAYDEALRHLQRAHELSPRRQMVLFQLAAAHRDKGDAAGALPYLKQAWEEAPDYGDARLRYGAGLLYAGRDREAQDVLLPVYGTMLIPEDQILAAYEHRGMYDTIIAVRKKELESSPNDQRLELALAAAYLKAGKRDDAVSVIQRVMSRDPSFKTQGAYYIDEIRAGRNP